MRALLPLVLARVGEKAMGARVGEMALGRACSNHSNPTYVYSDRLEQQVFSISIESCPPGP